MESGRVKLDIQPMPTQEIVNQSVEPLQPSFHDKGVTTYVAAEFTWPDGSRIETWGLRIEFRHTAENDGQITPFFCPATMDRADFLTGSP